MLQQLVDFPTGANYDAARRAWERIAWLQPIHPQATGTTFIDNNRHWISASATGHNYSETGAWQRLEAETRRPDPDTAVIRRQTSFIISHLHALQDASERKQPTVEEIRFLLATEIYRQYNLTLSGHHRLDTDRAVGDFLSFLTSLKEWDKHFSLFDEVDHCHLTNTISFCQGVQFECLDRYGLYRDYLRSLHQSLLRGIPIEKIANKYGIAATTNGELFSAAFMDPVTISYSPATADLGKLLFFDPLLSGNGRRSCASCHQPGKAYTDGRITSMAFNYPNRITRNAPSLINAITGYGGGGTDLAKPSSGHFIQSVFDHPEEMNVRMDTILSRLNRSTGYRNKFTSTFPNTGLDSTNVIAALEVFVVSLNAVDGSFDRELRAPTAPSDSVAIRGYNLFAGKAACGSCHFPPYFDGRKPPFYQEREYQAAGRSIHLTDHGIGGVLQDDRYDYFFRTAGLRNLSFSAPYAHDGYFITLQGFVEDHHGKEHLSSSELTDLLHFMSTLNDSIKLIDITEITLPQIDDLTSEKNRRPAGLY